MSSVTDESSRVQHLSTVKLFSDLKPEPRALGAISRIMKEREFANSAEIIREGSFGSELFVLIGGKVAVYKKPPEGEAFKVAILGSEIHPTFGESALIDAEPRSATIVSEGKASCLVLERADFDRFATEHPEWALPVYRRISQAVMARFKKSNDDLMLLYKALMAEIRGM